MWYTDGGPVDLRTAAEWKCHHLPTLVMSVISHTITSSQGRATLHLTHIHANTHPNGYSIGEKKQSESRARQQN